MNLKACSTEARDERRGGAFGLGFVSALYSDTPRRAASVRRHDVNRDASGLLFEAAVCARSREEYEPK